MKQTGEKNKENHQLSDISGCTTKFSEQTVKELYGYQ